MSERSASGADPHQRLLVAPYRRSLLQQLGWQAVITVLGVAGAVPRVYDFAAFGAVATLVGWRQVRTYFRLPPLPLPEVPDGSQREGSIRSALRLLLNWSWLMAGAVVGLLWSPIVAAVAGGVALGWAVTSARSAWIVIHKERELGWRILSTEPRLRRWSLLGRREKAIGYRDKPGP